MRFRVDHTGIALKMLIENKFIGFMLNSIVEDSINNGSLKVIEYESLSRIPTRTIYLTYLKKNKNAKQIESLLKFLKSKNLEG